MRPSALLLAVVAGGVASAQSGGVPVAPAVSASSHSVATLCAEHDNLSVFLSGNAHTFTVEATHPSYVVGRDNCEADFSNCPPAKERAYAFEPGVFKLFDNGETVVEAVREASWWRPEGMAVSIDQGQPVKAVHFIRLYERIAGADSWPQWFVLYADGNMRLIPHPPPGVKQVCFGASVIVGPAQAAERPLAEIRSLTYLSRTRSLRIVYGTGGSAVIRVLEVNRQRAVVSVAANYPAPGSTLAVLRSMFVRPGNADTDAVRWAGPKGEPHDETVMNFSGGPGTEWLFYRKNASKHNRSGPNIRIRLTPTAAGASPR